MARNGNLKDGTKTAPGQIGGHSVLLSWSEKRWPKMVISTDGTKTAPGKIGGHSVLFVWSGKR